MELSAGPGWQDQFDFCIFEAKKPLFWKANSPFVSVKNANMPLKLNSLKEDDGKLFTGGNANGLTKYFQKFFLKDNVRIAFFGTDF